MLWSYLGYQIPHTDLKSDVGIHLGLDIYLASHNVRAGEVQELKSRWTRYCDHGNFRAVCVAWKA